MSESRNHPLPPEVLHTWTDGTIINLRDLAAYRHLITPTAIASALARQRRWSGASPIPYSVAAHSVWVSRQLPVGLQYEGLMHDVTEAFVGDLTSPIKAICPAFRALEADVRRQISPWFGLAEPEPLTVKAVDTQSRHLEREKLWHSGPAGVWRETDWMHDREVWLIQYDRTSRLEGKNRACAR